MSAIKKFTADDLFAKCEGVDYFGLNPDTDQNTHLEPIFDSAPGREMMYQGQVMLNWSVNDYLGYAGDERVKAKAIEAMNVWGLSGPMGARMLTGNTREHVDLENVLAQSVRKESSVLVTNGYLGILGAIGSLVGGDDVLILDRLSHACIIDGALIAQSQTKHRLRFFRHNDMEDLEAHLKLARAQTTGGILIVTEGIFGMRGDAGRLDEICRLKAQFGARLLVDDAHGFRVMGPTGRGTGEHFGVHDQIDVYCSTFAKCYASIGGFIAGPKSVINYLRYNARQLMMTKSMPMPLVAQARVTHDLIEAEPERRSKLWENAKQLQHGLQEMGYSLTAHDAPVTAVKVAGTLEKLGRIQAVLRGTHRIYIAGVTFPAIPKGEIILRIIPTAKHTLDDVRRTLDIFKAMKTQILG